MTSPTGAVEQAGPTASAGSAGLDVRVQELSAALAAVTERADQLERELAHVRAQLNGGGPRFAELYADFTDRFRGTVSEVTAKLTGYLPDVDRLLSSGAAGVRVLDVGCGRGEWLTLLQERGIPAAGVDTGLDFVAAGRARGLDITLADGVEHLQGLPAGELDLVTAFHLIEHLDTEILLALFTAAHRVLRPGGCLLVETPNPTNLTMGACNFYLDPTHRSPLPPALTEYLMSACGFGPVDVRPLHADESPLNPDSAPTLVEQLVARSLRGPRDYAVLGYAGRPGDTASSSD